MSSSPGIHECHRERFETEACRSSMAHTIRQATVDDVEQLAPLFDAYRRVYGRTSDVAAARTFLLARFANRESTLSIAHQGDAAIGFAQLYPSFSSVSLARIFILNDLFVQEQARRIGVVSSLLSDAATVAVSLKAVRLSLSTALTNDAAQALYRSAGWNRDQQFSVYHLVLSV